MAASGPISRRAALALMGSAVWGAGAGAAGIGGDAIDVRAHGARGDRRGDDAPAFAKAYAAAIGARVPLYIPAGWYRLASPLVWDVGASRLAGIHVFGDGAQLTMLDFTGGSGGGVLLQCSGRPADSFYSRLHDFGVQGAGGGPALQVGRDDFADAHNACSFERLVVNANGGGPALRLNGVYGSHVDVVANCAGTGRGAAMQLRRTQFCSVFGAQGNAAVGTELADGYNFGNVFSAIDYEMLGTAVSIAGAQCVHNTWIGGTIANAAWGFDCIAGGNNQVDNINQAIPAARLSRNKVGLRFDPAPDATPARPTPSIHPKD